VDPDRQRAFLRIWAAASTPLLLLGIVVLLARPTPVTLSGFTRLLIVVAGLVVALLSNWQLALAGLLTVIAVLLLGSNLREIRHRPADARPSATEDPSSL
jgi:lysylphosphatidylglycerol synthetase-like protein (DUF2156 family)